MNSSALLTVPIRCYRRLIVSHSPFAEFEMTLRPPTAMDDHGDRSHGEAGRATGRTRGVNQPTGPDLFDAKLSEFQQWQDSPWGRLRYAVAAANLAKHLPPGPLSILDIGGGNGLDAIELAARGHHVTIADISEQSLAQARAIAADRGLADRISTRLADVRSLDREFPPGSVDVVLCHNLLSPESECLVRHVAPPRES